MWDPRHTNVGYTEFVGDFNLEQPVRATFGSDGGEEGRVEANRIGGKEANKITENGPIKIMWWPR